MQKVEIQIVGLQSIYRFKTCFDSRFQAKVCRPKFCCEENVFPSDLAFTYSLTDKILRSVTFCRVNQTVIALVDGVENCVVIISAIMGCSWKSHISVNVLYILNIRIILPNPNLGMDTPLRRRVVLSRAIKFKKTAFQRALARLVLLKTYILTNSQRPCTPLL